MAIMQHAILALVPVGTDDEHPCLDINIEEQGPCCGRPAGQCGRHAVQRAEHGPTKALPPRTPTGFPNPVAQLFMQRFAGHVTLNGHGEHGSRRQSRAVPLDADRSAARGTPETVRPVAGATDPGGRRSTARAEWRLQRSTSRRRSRGMGLALLAWAAGMAWALLAWRHPPPPAPLAPAPYGRRSQGQQRDGQRRAADARQLPLHRVWTIDDKDNVSIPASITIDAASGP